MKKCLSVLLALVMLLGVLPLSPHISANEVSGESDDGVFWKLLDVPETESFYNYAKKNVGWLTRLGMSKSTDPLSQEATYTSGDPSGLFTRKSGDEYFVIFNPAEEYNSNGKLKEANGGVMYNTLSGRGLTEDGEAKLGVPEGITAEDATYMAVRFKISGGTAEQYSSVSFRLGDAGFIALTNAYLIDKTTGAVSNSHLSGNLLGITGEFDGWLMIPWNSLSLSQREFIQSTGGTIQCYFHSELCTTASHGKDTASDWHDKILWLGDVALVDDEAQFLQTYADKAVAEKGMTFSASDMHVIRGAFEQMPNTFQATMRFPADYHPSFRGGVILGNNGYERENLNFQIAANGHPQIYARHDGTAYTMTFDQVNVYTGEWMHVAVVNDSEARTMTCYVNGVAAQTIEGCIPSFISEQAGVLGGDVRNGNSNYFTGELGTVVLYTQARDAAEIAIDAQQFANGSPLAAWDLTKQTTDDVIVDESGNGYAIQKGTVWMTDAGTEIESDYSFALVGDTQIVNRYYADRLPLIYDWILDNKESKNIQYVMGLGDITDADAAREWTDAAREHAKLDGVIPYSLVRGNHDSFEKFNATFDTAPYNESFDGKYGEGVADTWREVTVNGMQYLIFALDIGASDEVLAWASDVIEEHPYHNVIVTTHVYLNSDGHPVPSTHNDRASKYSVHDNPNEAEEIWDKFISKHENIVLVISGHISSNVVVATQREGDHGNVVTELLVDPQGLDKNIGGTGMVTLLHFSDQGKRVQVETVSTANGLHYMPYNQFALDIPASEPHFHAYEKDGAVVTVEPTCTEDGHTTKTCDTCGRATVTKKPATGHTYADLLDSVCDTCGGSRSAGDGIVGMLPIRSVYQYVGGAQDTTQLGAAENSAIYAANGKVYTALRIPGRYVTASADFSTVVLDGVTYPIEERGIILGKEGQTLTVDSPNKVSVNSNFNSTYWEYDASTKTVTYTALVKNITRENKDVRFIARSYVKVRVNGTVQIVYSDTSPSFSPQGIYDNMANNLLAQGKVAPTWFTLDGIDDGVVDLG